MIVKMQKYAFLVYHKEYEEFLQKLRDLGVVHVEPTEDGVTEDETLTQLLGTHQKVTRIIKELHKYPAKEAAEKLTAAELLESYSDLITERDYLQADQEHFKKELAVTAPWGEFDPTILAKLQESGKSVLLYSCSSRNYKSEWEEAYDLFKINQVGSLIYFVVVTNGDTPTIEADLVKMPTHSLSSIKTKLTHVENNLVEHENKLGQLSSQVQTLEAYEAELKEKLTFSEVVNGSEKVADAKVVVLQGWVPDIKSEQLKTFLEKEGVLFEMRKPDFKEQVPILLKNNKFNRLFEMIGELYSMPKYAEMDLTPYFAPFYWLFFGFCLGDAGYGLLLVLGGLLMRNRVVPKLKNALTLVGLLGISTIIFGIIGGTFFGMNLFEMKFSIWGDVARYFDPVSDGEKFNINDHLFNLALILGAIQILFGMFIKVVNETKMYGIRYAFGTIGWLILIVGGGAIYGLSTTGVSQNIVTVLTWGVVALGGAGALLLNNPERNVLANFGAGLWDAYNMVTGLLGDLLSYIRLFALGISSAILGYVFNSLAVSLSPDQPVVKIIVMVIILLIGHGINLFMAALGSFVHPMRLTFVEFYKNSGFQGGGKKYQPFSKSID